MNGCQLAQCYSLVAGWHLLVKVAAVVCTQSAYDQIDQQRILENSARKDNALDLSPSN